MKLNGHAYFFARLWSMQPMKPIKVPPSVTSDRIKDLLSKALLTPNVLVPAEVREIAMAVVYHLVEQKKEEDGRAAGDVPQDGGATPTAS